MSMRDQQFGSPSRRGVGVVPSRRPAPPQPPSSRARSALLAVAHGHRVARPHPVHRPWGPRRWRARARSTASGWPARNRAATSMQSATPGGIARLVFGRGGVGVIGPAAAPTSTPRTPAASPVPAWRPADGGGVPAASGLPATGEGPGGRAPGAAGCGDGGRPADARHAPIRFLDPVGVRAEGSSRTPTGAAPVRRRRRSGAAAALAGVASERLTASTLAWPGAPEPQLTMHASHVRSPRRSPAGYLRSQDHQGGCRERVRGSRRNVALERLLARAGWTPENLGARCNELAATLGLGVYGHPRNARRWVYAPKGRPVPAVPREPWPSLVCHLLHQRLGEPVTLESLGWNAAAPLRYVPADDGLDQPWNSGGAVAALAEVVDADSMERRQFLALTGVTLTAGAHQWLFDPARVAASVMGKRVDHAVVDDLERVADARRRIDDAIGGGALLRAVREDLRLVVSLLANAAYTEAVGVRLHAVAAEFGRLAGWLAFDSEQPALAQRYYLAALRAAHVSGDRAIGANILGFMSAQAAKSDRPCDAVTLAESALAVESSLSPAVAGSVYGRLAVGAAQVGDASAARRALDKTFELQARVVSKHEPSWIYWFSEAEAQSLAGRSLLALGRFPEADRHLRRAVASLDPAFARERALWLARLATARLGMGRVDQAFVTANEAATMIRRLDSPRDRRVLADFRKAAKPYARSTVVREFDAKHRDLLGAPSA